MIKYRNILYNTDKQAYRYVVSSDKAKISVTLGSDIK